MKVILGMGVEAPGNKGDQRVRSSEATRSTLLRFSRKRTIGFGQGQARDQGFRALQETRLDGDIRHAAGLANRPNSA
jgi:hypothetical protein